MLELEWKGDGMYGGCRPCRSDTRCHCELCFMSWFRAAGKVSLQGAASKPRETYSAFLMANGNEPPTVARNYLVSSFKMAAE